MKNVGFGLTADNLLKVSGDVHNIIIAGHGPPGAMEPTRYHRKYPHADIHCFEPQRDFYRECLTRYRGIDEIHMYDEALGHVDDSATLHVSDVAGWSSLFTFNPLAVVQRKQDDEYVVPMTTVDSFCRRKDISMIDLLFLDVQGSEHLVFQGSVDMLAGGAVKVIIGESIFTDLHSDPHSFWKSYGILSVEHGYQFVGWYAPSKRGWGRVMFCDYVFARPDIVRKAHDAYD